MGLTPQQSASVRQRRWSIFAATLLGLVVLAGIAVTVGALGGSDPTDDLSSCPGGQVRGCDETKGIYAGVPQRGIVLGRPDAPATITVFADVKCPFCRDHFIKGDQKTLVDDEVRTGRANMELRLVALKQFRPDTLLGRDAVNDLAARGRAWNLAQMLYSNQKGEGTRWVTPAAVERIARVTPGVDAAVSTRATPAATAIARETDALADRLGVDGTPKYFVRARGQALEKDDEVSIGRFDDAREKIAGAVAKARPSR